MADLDITLDANLTSMTAPAVADRLVATKNATGELQDLTLENLLKVVNGLTEDTSPTSSDYLLEYDASGAAAAKVKSTNLLVTDSKVQFTDITTGNASASNHGFLPKLSGAGSNVLLGDGTWGILTGSASPVYKTANETVNNSTTLQNDDHLLFSVTANKSYRILLYLVIETAASSGADDFKMAWSLPAGCSGYWGNTHDNSAVDGFTPGGLTASTANTQSITTTYSFGYTGSTTFIAKTEAILVVAGTAGTVTLQWAQNTAGARDLKVLAGSFLIYQLLN